MADTRGEGRPVKERGRQDVQRVEPAPGLADVLHDEIAREVPCEPFGVLKRVVHLGERHRARVEPDVEHVLDAPHRGPARRVVGVRPGEFVDERPVQVGNLHTEVLLEFGEGAVDVDPGVRRVVGSPDRDRGAPEPVARDRPVAGVLQPLAELAVLDVLRHPGDLLVELKHPALDLGDLDKPRRHRHVDQRLPTAPAVGVGVVVGLAAQQHRAGGDRATPVLEMVDDRQVGVEDLQALVVGDRVGEAAVGTHWHHRLDAGRVQGGLVFLTEAGRHVHDARAVLGGHEVRAQHLVSVGIADVVGERRRIGAPHQIAAGEPLDHVRLVRTLVGQFAGVRREPRRAQDIALRCPGKRRLDHDVLHVGSHGDAHIGGQRPRGRGPDQREFAGVQPETDGHRGILAVLVDVVVHPQFVVGQRRLIVPAVGKDPESLVDQALVVELFEGPDHALHVVRVERAVVVLEVDPAGLAGDVLLPLVGVLEHGLAALVVEGFDPDLEDLLLRLDAQLAHRLQLGGKTMGVPAEAALDPAPAHRLVPRHDILDVAGQQVPVVRQPVRERRAVVEHELVVPLGTAGVRGRPLRHTLGEGAVLLPVGQHRLFDRREPRRGGYADRYGRRSGVGDPRIGHGGLLLVRRGSSGGRALKPHEDDPSRDRGTTSLVPPKRDRSLTAVTGLPVRFYWARPAETREPFFRRLAADDGSDVYDHIVRRATLSAPTRDRVTYRGRLHGDLAG